MTKWNNCFALALLASLAGQAAEVSAAPPASTAPSVRVSYADLDLTTAAGRETLGKRVRGAVASVCRLSGSYVLSDLASSGHCRRATFAQARNDMQVAMLKAERQLASR